MDALRLLIADDHALFREGLRAFFNALADIEVVGEATTGEEAVQQANALQPDVILMDVNMPALNGIDATRRILHTSPHIGIVMVTMLDDGATVFNAMRAGARGYVLKGAQPDEMVQAIRAVAGGQVLLGPAVAQRLTAYFAAPPPTPSIPYAFPELTEREREVLNLIAHGHRNPDIAQRLSISPKTLRNHITNIFDKLQVADRAQAILRAREAGMG